MSKGQRFKPKQIVTLLCKIIVLITIDKTLTKACKELVVVEQSCYRQRKICGGMKVDQVKKFKELEADSGFPMVVT